MRIEHIQDIAGNNYLGINIYTDRITNFLNELKDILDDDFDVYTQNQKHRDREHYHITVVNVAEYNSLSKKMGPSEFVNSLEKVFNFEIDDLQMLGIGTASKNTNTTYFIVCKSDKLDSVRKRYELPKFDFHITIGFKHKDVFGIPKNIVMPKKSKFLKLIKNEFLEKENFNFVRRVDGFDESSDSEIVPVQLSDNFLKIICNDYIMGIGFCDQNNKLKVFTKYNKNSEKLDRLPITEIIKILNKN